MTNGDEGKIQIIFRSMEVGKFTTV